MTKTGSDDPGSAVDGLDEVSRDDAALLVSRPLREDFDACVDGTVPPSGNNGPEEQSYNVPTVISKPVAAKLNLKPAHPIRADQPVNSPIELIKSLVSMFSSYARDAGQQKTYAVAGGCLPTLVYSAVFSQKTLHHLAGGAALGAGSISEVHSGTRRLHDESNADSPAWLLSGNPCGRERDTMRCVAPGPVLFSSSREGGCGPQQAVPVRDAGKGSRAEPLAAETYHQEGSRPGSTATPLPFDPRLEEPRSKEQIQLIQ
ncbi:hypothetical protein [Streptomyces sp. NPDC059631]|uniref:hypothetical protein n=1 Tax=unclassified Streptomyces TaxID=2593676 RepID=UPI0036A70531